MNKTGDGSAIRSPQDDVLLKKSYQIAQWKILPVLFFLWMLAWVDRSNVAFAKLQMLNDLKWSETVYGLGAGLFFVGYVLFGVPTAIAQARFGARRVLAGVAICWGLTSVAMMFVQSVSQFYILRLCLGMFEAGFYPGVVLYFNSWFGGKRRARNFSIFHSGGVCSTVAVGLTGGWVLSNMNGVGGMEGWRWMFCAQAVPTVILAFIAYFTLPDRPETATWLSRRQRELIVGDLISEPDRLDGTHTQSRSLFFNSAIWILSGAYFCILASTTALIFFTPTILREAGFGGYREIGFAVAGICILGALGNVVMSTLGGEPHRRGPFCALGMLIAGASLISLIFVWHSSTVLTFAALTLAFAGSQAAVSLFWQVSVGLVERAAMNVAVPFISSVANVAGFVTPFIIGHVRDVTGTYASGFVAAACVQGIGVLLLLFGTAYILRQRSVSQMAPGSTAA